MMLPAGSVALRYSGDATGPALARIGVGNALIFTVCLLVISYHDRFRLLSTAHNAQIRAQDAGRTAEQVSAAGRIAASLAHEVNNPLAAVTNLLYLAEHSDMGPAARSYLQQAQSELGRVTEITTHTLQFYRQQHAAVSASVPEMVDSILLLFDSKLQTQHISVNKAWQTGLPDVHCRDGEIRQVIANLVRNALDAMPHGGILSVSGRVVEHSIELAVTDTGEGISKGAMEKVFQPFFTTKAPVGTGLGLSISKDIVEKHGGTLTFESETMPPGRGTTFKMVIPRDARENGLLSR